MSDSGSLTADEVIQLLQLQAHPEGGYFRETFRDAKKVGERSASTAIYFLLKQGEISGWHRIDAVEVWHWYGGAPIRLQIREGEGPVETVLLGNTYRRMNALKSLFKPSPGKRRNARSLDISGMYSGSRV